MMTRTLRVAILLGGVGLTLSACQTAPRTTELVSSEELESALLGSQALQVLIEDHRTDTLLIVSASGGGTRAAALTMGVLKGLDSITSRGTERTLLQEVDIISSVSGSSVTAAYYSLHGRDGLDSLENDYLKRNVMWQIAARLLNPINLLQALTPSRSRLDAFIDYLRRDSLFGDSTFADIADRRPYLLLNAADMEARSNFVFSQTQFDLICSNLHKFRLADAVAASAAYPVVLAPLALKNHSPCAALPVSHFWPPVWVASNSQHPEPAFRSDDGIRAAYANLDCRSTLGQCRRLPDRDQKKWVYLLDGGIADNLGLLVPVRLLTTFDEQRGFAEAVLSGEIKYIVFVVINAGASRMTRLSQSGHTPGLLPMLSAATGSAITSASNSMMRGLDSGIRQFFDEQPSDYFDSRELYIEVINVDFDLIKDYECRMYFNEIKTTWNLKDEQVDALLAMGEALLKDSFQLQFLTVLHGFSDPPTEWTHGVYDTCKRVLSDSG